MKSLIVFQTHDIIQIISIRNLVHLKLVFYTIYFLDEDSSLEYLGQANGVLKKTLLYKIRHKINRV